jgi:hypothetical protein
LAIGEYPQIINDITKSKRNIPVALALKIEKQLELEEGTLCYYKVIMTLKKEK